MFIFDFFFSKKEIMTISATNYNNTEIQIFSFRFPFFSIEVIKGDHITVRPFFSMNRF